MANPRQRRKQRSGIAKVRHKAPSKKKILANPIIAANWNQKETLAQNYKRLGLASRLNHATGGIEKIASTATDKPATNELDIKSKIPTTLTPSEARIERDPTTGAITRVIDDGSAESNPLNDPLNEVLDDDEDEWDGFGNVPKGGAGSGVVAQLEEEASRGERKAPRKQSTREEEWIEALVEKYGDDYGKMFRDRKLNPMQQSEGDIKRRVKKWREKHGA